MLLKVPRIIKLLNQIGILMEYLVMKPSKNPAAIVNGKVLKKF